MTAGDSTEVKIKTIATDTESNAPIVILVDAEERNYLPIYIGQFEAFAITTVLNSTEVSRPMTHDLMKSAMAAAGMRVERVTITALQGSTYMAEMTVSVHGRQIELDSRPSDAMAMAVRFSAPIMVANDVLAKAALSTPETNNPGTGEANA